MGLYVPTRPQFQWSYSNTTGVQPGAAYGASVIPSISTYGTWTQVATSANISTDVFGVYIVFNSGTTVSTTRNILVEMGVDNSGGTNYVSVIPFLNAGNSSIYTNGSAGICYYFPLYIKAGSSVAFRGTSNDVSAFRVGVRFYGSPTRPDTVSAGSYVDAFGEVFASRIGTSVTPGTTSEGSWTQLGSAATRSYWWLQGGFGVNNSTMNNGTYNLDLSVGNASNKQIIIEDQLGTCNVNEAVQSLPVINAYCSISVGDLIYARLQTSATTTGTHVIAYALGG